MVHQQILTGRTVDLLPLEAIHQAALLAAAADGELWSLWYTSVPGAATIAAYLRQALQERTAGSAFPYVVQDRNSGKIIGTTRYCNIDMGNRRLEIGYTWYAKTYQRTAANTEAKFLLLQNAFENLECIAVEFRTHWFNEKSRAAILRLGAKQDGVLRNHRIDAAGVLRDTVVFSITAAEWPAVRQALRHKLTPAFETRQ